MIIWIFVQPHQGRRLGWNIQPRGDHDLVGVASDSHFPTDIISSRQDSLRSLWITAQSRLVGGVFGELHLPGKLRGYVFYLRPAFYVKKSLKRRILWNQQTDKASGFPWRESRLNYNIDQLINQIGKLIIEHSSNMLHNGFHEGVSSLRISRK